MVGEFIIGIIVEGVEDRVLISGGNSARSRDRLAVVVQIRDQYLLRDFLAMTRNCITGCLKNSFSLYFTTKVKTLFIDLLVLNLRYSKNKKRKPQQVWSKKLFLSSFRSFFFT